LLHFAELSVVGVRTSGHAVEQILDALIQDLINRTGIVDGKPIRSFSGGFQSSFFGCLCLKLWATYNKLFEEVLTISCLRESGCRKLYEKGTIY
jgi:hypothetical protein